ncbi:MAG: hypothetical protein C5B59_03095 [Bacteroidetes bacterium]|nr:MAG: hypothetical protein C5B59_03095 [Bacteroidota bacterium]
MISKPFHIVSIFLLFHATIGFSQNNPTVKASVNKHEILIGEPVDLRLEVNIPPQSHLAWPTMDSIPHFEFLKKGEKDSVESTEGKSFVQHFTLTSFDSGSRTIPPMSFTIDGHKFSTDSLVVEVGFSKFDPKQDYHDIKDIIDVENPGTKYIIWILVAVTAASMGLLIYYIAKTQFVIEPVEEEVPVSRLSPFDEAVQSLKELQKLKLPENGQVKMYYTRLNDILRLYVLRKFQIHSLEKTNEELIMQLGETKLTRDEFSHLASSLRMSDFVKFARYLPDPEENEKNFVVIESSIHRLNEIEN